MARTTIAVQAPIGSRISGQPTAGSMDYVYTAADVSNLNQAAFGTYSSLILLVNNTDVGATTITITSAADPFGRTTDITAYALATLDFAMNIFSSVGWKQSDGMLYFQASDAQVLFAVIGVN